MGYTPTPIDQGSAKVFRENINQNFVDIQAALSYTPGEG